MNKEEIRQRAAIAVLPECVRTRNEVLLRGGKLTEKTQAKQAAMRAVAYADELAEKLSNVSENGKDLQLAVNEEIKRRCERINVNEMVKKIQDIITDNPDGIVAHLSVRGSYKLGIEDTIKKLKGE